MGSAQQAGLPITTRPIWLTDSGGNITRFLGIPRISLPATYAAEKLALTNV